MVPGPMLTPNPPATLHEGPRSSDPRAGELSLDSPSLYINRELSWLEFNARVLAEAESPATPLFERLKFLAIVASNLDEFFMVRVAGLKHQILNRVVEVSPDGATPVEQMAAISARAHELSDLSYRIWNSELRPALAREGILLLKPEELPPEALEALDRRFRSDIYPVLTPITIDPNHPFPHLKNKSINLGVLFSREQNEANPSFGVVQVPVVLSRLMAVPHVGARAAFVLLEDVIARHIEKIFPGYKLKGAYSFRVTRNWDLEIDEEEAEDLLLTIQQELRRRDRGNAVRVEIAGATTPGSLSKLCAALKLNEPEDVYRVAGPLHLADLTAMVAREDRRDLRDEPAVPHVVPPLRDTDDLFAVVRERDVLLHHPYESFESIVDFVSRAADDPNVLAIKQTLYRAGGDSPIVRALARAAENGKQVTAIVELKARFDEESNIRWASTLENSGVHVVYGLQGLKTHAKAMLIVRREKERLRRYCHLATGNYNPVTARHYTDLSLLTSREEIGEDVTAFFNLLTSYSAPPKWNALCLAPLGLQDEILRLINREADHARAGRPASIVAKLNALVDHDVVVALYAAARAGVDITLLIRGICCLRPGIPGVSDRIKVLAVVDRFLEHTRAAWFANNGDEQVFISSADWMPRNFHRRIELLIPVLDPELRKRITGEVMGTMMADNCKAWTLNADGRYTRVEPGEPSIRSQHKFLELTQKRVKEADTSARATKRFQLARPLGVEPTQHPRRKRRPDSSPR